MLSRPDICTRTSKSVFLWGLIWDKLFILPLSGLAHSYFDGTHSIFRRCLFARSSDLGNDHHCSLEHVNDLSPTQGNYLIKLPFKERTFLAEKPLLRRPVISSLAH